MASTNKTPNLGLPQFIGTDKPSWLVDFNGAMHIIDEKVHESNTNANEAVNTANDALNTANDAKGEINGYTADIEQANNTANEALNTANSAAADIEQVNTIAGNALSTANTAVTQLGNLKSNLLITGEIITERFSAPNDYGQILNGDKGSTLRVTSTSGNCRFSKADITFTTSRTNGEFKCMGRLTFIKESASGNSTISGKIFPNNYNFNLGCHLFAVFTNSSGVTSVQTFPIEIRDGVFSLTFTWGNNTALSVYLFDSIITRSILN